MIFASGCGTGITGPTDTSQTRIIRWRVLSVHIMSRGAAVKLVFSLQAQAICALVNMRNFSS